MTAAMDGKMLVWDNSTLALRVTCQHSEVLRIAKPAPARFASLFLCSVCVPELTSVS